LEGNWHVGRVVVGDDDIIIIVIPTPMFAVFGGFMLFFPKILGLLVAAGALMRDRSCIAAFLVLRLGEAALTVASVAIRNETKRQQKLNRRAKENLMISKKRLSLNLRTLGNG